MGKFRITETTAASCCSASGESVVEVASKMILSSTRKETLQERHAPA